MQLTSKDHDCDFVSVGAGGWDGEHQPSWVNLDRVIRVHEGGMRREAAALPREPFERVTGWLHQRHGLWGFRTRPLVLTWALCGSLVFADEATEDMPSLDSFLGEVGGRVVGPRRME